MRKSKRPLIRRIYTVSFSEAEFSAIVNALADAKSRSGGIYDELFLRLAQILEDDEE